MKRTVRTCLGRFLKRTQRVGQALLALPLLVGSVLAPQTGAAQTDTLAIWTYEPLIGPTSGPTPNAGVNQATGTSAVVGSLTVAATSAGATTNGCAQAGGTAAWSFTANPGPSNESSGVEYRVSTAGFENIIFSWDHRKSGTATRTERVQFTLDGTNWTNLDVDGTNYDNTSCTNRGGIDLGRIDNTDPVGSNASDTWGRRIVDFSSISGANDNPNFGIRILAAHYSTTGQFRQANNVANVATGGTWRFDNVTFAGDLIPVTPATQDSEISFSNVLTSAFDVSWTAGDGARRIVILNTSNSFTAPADGSDPAADPAYSGSGEQVVFNGTGTSVTVTGLSPNTTYWVRVYAYNGTGSETLYNTGAATNNPNSQTTAAAAAPTKLVVTDVNGGNNVVENFPFILTIQSQDDNDLPQVVSQDTDVELSVFQGFGSLYGTITGTILAGTDEITITGVQYDSEDPALIIEVAVTNGDVLTEGQTNEIDVLGEATSLTFSGLPATGTAGQAVGGFQVSAIRNDASVATEFTGAITLGIFSGTGNLLGTVTENAVAGVATFSDVIFDTFGSKQLEATSGSLTGTSGTIEIAGLTEVILPQYAVNGTATADRVQYVCRLQLDGLAPNTTFRYLTGATQNANLGLTTAPGNMFVINNTPNASGHVVGHTSNKNLGGALMDGDEFVGVGRYGEFTTDANGSYAGWFSMVPTGNAQFDAGNEVYLYLNLNDGNDGTAIVRNFRTQSTISVLAASTSARAIAGNSSAAGENMVFIYDNEAGTGRPLYGTWAENDGITTNFTWYEAAAGSTPGAWGAYVPTALATGVRRIEQRSVVTGDIVDCPGTSADGTWAGAGNTVNPSAGTTPIVFTTDDANFDEAVTYYADADGDGFGDPNDSVTACEQPVGYVTNDGDCDDNNDQVWIGATCDDGDPDTVNDTIDANCDCVGVPANLDCEGVEDGPALPGTSCDDGDPNTIDDEWDNDCNCVGIPLDCNGVPNGPDVVGAPCDDGDPNTGNDVYDANCDCVGALIDCLGVAGGSDLPGSACDDGDPTTTNDLWDNDCNCAGTPFQFGAGNIVVERVGTGAVALSGTATEVFIEEYLNNVADQATVVSSFAMPGEDPQPGSAPFNLTESGSATSAGYMTRSSNRAFLAVPGYNAVPGTASVTGTTSAAVGRTIGTVALNGTVSTPTAIDNMFSANNYRSVTSDGTSFWAAGNGSGATSGIFYIPNTSATSGVSVFAGNLRNVEIFNGDLFFSRGSGTQGIYRFDGLPTSAETPTLVLAVNNPYHFAINADEDILYVAVDGAYGNTAGSGGVQRYDWNGSSWGFTYTLRMGAASTAGARGLTVDFSGANPIVYATTTEANNNRIVRVLDNGDETDAINGANAINLAFAGVNRVFRGVAFAPEDEVVDPPVCTENIRMTIHTDGAGNETTWAILPVGGGPAVCSGGPYVNNASIEIDCCVPAGCYRLEVYDAGGNGMSSGGYILTTQDGRRIIDNRDAGDFGSLSAIANGGAFCLPLGDDQLIFYHCDRVEFLAGDYITVTPNAAVSAQFQTFPVINYTQQDATSGYQYWFFEPNGSYSRRIYQGLNVYNGWDAQDPERAGYLNFSWIQTNPLPVDQVLNVRVRSRVSGVYAEFGPACRVQVLGTPPACPTTELVDNPANQTTFSCGVVRSFGVGQKIYANPVAGANRYQFNITNPGEGYARNIASNNAALVLNWLNNPMTPSDDAYQVRVRVSFDGGATYCDFGDVCLVTIVATPGAEQRMAEAARVAMWPNPNRDGQLWLSVEGANDALSLIGVDIFDMYGKRVFDRMVPVQQGMLNTVLELDGRLASGMYMVNITMGGERRVERLVIAR